VSSPARLGIIRAQTELKLATHLATAP
jgi:hypothetical protein